MERPRRFPLIVWLAAVAIAALFVAWVGERRVGRVDFVSQLGDPLVTADAGSPTGFADGRRLLVVPGHNNESYQWIAQTQQMIAEGTWRLRHVGYDNAPNGRAVTSPSAYRWWLATVAWCNSTFTGQSLGLAVERAGVWADPVAQVLLLILAGALAVRTGGAPGAMLVVLGIVAVHPANISFQPGSPDDYSLIQGALLLMALTMLAGVRSAGLSAAGARRWFIVSGVLGGVGLWLSVNTFAIALVGISAGAVAVYAWDRGRGEVSSLCGNLPWRAWGAAGAIATFAAWLIENAPDRLGLLPPRLEQVHPLYAIAWLGCCEVIAVAARWSRGRLLVWNGRTIATSVLAVAAIAAVPAAMFLGGNKGFLLPHAYAGQVGGSAEGAQAANLAGWFAAEGFSMSVVAACVPALIALLAVLRLRQVGIAHDARAGIALLMTPLLIALVLGCGELGWMNQSGTLAVALLPLLPQASAAADARAWLWASGLALLMLPGVFTTVPPRLNPDDPAVTRPEIEGLIERDIAYRIAQRAAAEGAIVLAPPNLTASAIFHGGLHGLGSPYRENEDGFRASVRIAGATSADEALALVNQRGLTHILVPSWDGFMDEYARLGATNPEHSLMGLLRTWLPPRWLRPVAFQLPQIPGFLDHDVVIFEVTEVQDNATVLARLAEYFLEMGRPHMAAQVSRTLGEAFASDLGAQAARARTELARRDHAAIASVLEQIEGAIEHSADEALVWDRRVSLAVALALAGRQEAARRQAARCLEEMGEYELRGLSSGELYRFLSLCKTFGLEIRDESLRRIANSLVPPEFNFQM